MRKIKAAAIQPAYIGIPDEYNFFINGSSNSPEEIVKNHILKHSETTLKLLEAAGQAKCDIVTTSENLMGTSYFSMNTEDMDIYPRILDLACPLIETRLSDIARKYSMHIVACYNKKVGDRCYNVASVFDRTGSICGEYRKTHIPPDEKWRNSPGDTIDVIRLDFGKIGICICYDMMFPEFLEVLALKGAEVVFHPTAGYGWYDSIGEATLRTRANDNSVYIVTSKNYIFNSAGKSSIIDFWGQVLVDAGFYENVTVSCEIDLDFRKKQPDWYNPTVMSGLDDVRKRNLAERRPELYGIIGSKLHDSLRIPDSGRQGEIIEKIREGKCRWRP